jgi:hypothetical protein
VATAPFIGINRLVLGEGERLPEMAPSCQPPKRALTSRDEAGKSVFKSFVTPKWFVRPPSPGH